MRLPLARRMDKHRRLIQLDPGPLRHRQCPHLASSSADCRCVGLTRRLVLATSFSACSRRDCRHGHGLARLARAKEECPVGALPHQGGLPGVWGQTGSQHQGSRVVAFRRLEMGGSPLEVADGHPATTVSSRATEARTSRDWGSSPADIRTRSMTVTTSWARSSSMRTSRSAKFSRTS